MLNKLLMFLVSAIALGFLSFTAAPPQLPASFQEQLAAARMRFRAPGGTVPVPVVANAQMSYDYAVKFPDRKLEIRYAIRPLGQLLAEYKQSKKSKNEVVADPNQLYPSLVMAIAANVSGGTMPDINPFPPAAVQREFHADWGGTTVVKAGAEFAPGYANCMIVALHKKNVADVYYFYLFDKREDIETLMAVATADTAAFHSLQFKP